MTYLKRKSSRIEKELRRRSTRENMDISIKQALRRKRISIVKTKEDQLMDFVNEEIDEGLKNVRDAKLLLHLLLKTQVFKQYTYLTHFSKEDLINSFKIGKYVKVKKNEILFRQGDKTDSFYLVLSGSIGFILTTYEDNILKTNPYSREVNSIGAGAYFGEWGLIYKINRTVTAYAKEDTVLLRFEKYVFKCFYHDNIIISDNNNKKFVLKHIKTFKELNETSFNSYYREIKKIFCTPGLEIFHKGAPADSFYLVYRGSCVVKNGLTNLIIKDSGDFIGIESLFTDKYETTIYPYTDGTVLYKILLNSLGKNIMKSLKEEFEDYYKKQKKIIKVSIENYKNYKDKYQMNFINLIENMKRNKMENSKRANNVNMEEIRDNNDSKKNSHNSAPYKVRKFFNLSNYNNYNNNKINSLDSTTSPPVKSKNLYEEIKINYFKSPIETSRKRINLDTNNSNSGLTLEKKSQQRNNNCSANKIIHDTKNNENNNIRPYSSLKKTIYSTHKGFLYPKKKLNFFNHDTNNNIIFLKQMKKDNHFSSQNFKLKKEKKKIRLPLTGKLIRNKSINNTSKEKNYFQPILINNLNNKNNCDFHGGKFGNSAKRLKNKFCQSEKRLKHFDKKTETNKNLESNLEIPLLIIRNVSFYSPKKF
jgi:CRP-like cAMP-binding protein